MLVTIGSLDTWSRTITSRKDVKQTLKSNKNYNNFKKKHVHTQV